MFTIRQRRQLIHGAVIIVTFVVAGCSSGAERVVKEYLNQEACRNRSRFILDSDKYGEALEKHYPENKDCIVKHGKINASSCREIAVGEYCTVSVEKTSTPYCVKRVAEGDYKIDWPCSVGWNPTPLKVVLAERPGIDKPVVLRVAAELSDYFPSAVDRDHDLSVRLKDDSDSETFFMPLNRKVPATGATLAFENGAKLKELLRDGRMHNVIVEVAYLKEKDDALPFVSWFFQDGWRTIADADMATKQKEKADAVDEWANPGRALADKIGSCCKALTKHSDDAQAGSDRVSKALAAFFAEKCWTNSIKLTRGEITLETALNELGVKRTNPNADDRPIPPECSNVSP